MIKLDLNDLYVTSYETDPGDPVEPGDGTTTRDEEEMVTQPQQCHHSQQPYCITFQQGCESGGGAVC